MQEQFYEKYFWTDRANREKNKIETTGIYISIRML